MYMLLMNSILSEETYCVVRGAGVCFSCINHIFGTFLMTHIDIQKSATYFDAICFEDILTAQWNNLILKNFSQVPINIITYTLTSWSSSHFWVNFRGAIRSDSGVRWGFVTFIIHVARGWKKMCLYFDAPILIWPNQSYQNPFPDLISVHFSASQILELYSTKDLPLQYPVRHLLSRLAIIHVLLIYLRTERWRLVLESIFARSPPSQMSSSCLWEYR